MQDAREVWKDYNEWYYGDHQHKEHHPYKKKKKSVLDVFGDLFD